MNNPDWPGHVVTSGLSAEASAAAGAMVDRAQTAVIGQG